MDGLADPWMGSAGLSMDFCFLFFNLINRDGRRNYLG